MGGKGKHRSTRKRPRRKRKQSNYAGKRLNSSVKVKLSNIEAKILGPVESNSDLVGLSRRQVVIKARQEFVEKSQVVPDPGLIKQKTKDLENKLKRLEKDKNISEQKVSDINKIYNLWDGKEAATKTAQLPKNQLEHVPKHSGAVSYNPSVKDHMEGLRKVVNQEALRIERIKGQKTMRSILKFKKIKTNESYQLLDESSDEEIAGPDANAEPQSYRTTQYKKKSKKQRKTQKQMKKLDALAKKRKQSRIFSDQLNNIRSIKRKVVQEEKQKAELKKAKRSKLADDPLKESVQVILPADMSQKLSEIVPHGNILSDRFKHMKSRNMFEIGKKTHKRK